MLLGIVGDEEVTRRGTLLGGEDVVQETCQSQSWLGDHFGHHFPSLLAVFWRLPGGGFEEKYSEHEKGREIRDIMCSKFKNQPKIIYYIVASWPWFQ